mgnify:CR=1 FL=1|tara:strand:+ start:756 stop:977 length:222 start_codon:yes stop_codon:yes gene_type:complete
MEVYPFNEIVIIFFHFINGLVAEITVSATTPLSTCNEMVEKIATLEHLPEGLRYKGNKVFAFYCKGINGGWIQ